MGYRSNVVLVFYTRMQDKMPLPALKLWFDENYPVADAMDDWGADIETGRDHIMVRYHDVKWYEGYIHPGAVDVAIDKFAETFDADGTDTVAWEMVRVGEEQPDIENRHSTYCDWRLNVNRDIVFD